MMQAAIYGLEGFALKDEERDFFRDAEPAGYILFRRNCESRTAAADSPMRCGHWQAVTTFPS